MIVKLKCVDNIDIFGKTSTYLTVGRIYIAKPIATGLYELVDDDDDVIITLVSGSTHGKWEIME